MAISYFVRMRAREGQESAVGHLLLSNVERVREEGGNLAFAVHRSRRDPREFWLYETWVDLDAVEEHESGPAFREYKERLRPLVEPDSVLFGDTEPLAALGYRLPDAGETLPERFVRALATGDEALLDEVYDPEVVLYTPLGWPIRGREALKEFVGQFHAAYPGLRVTLHDQFFSPDGTRACFRFVIHYRNLGPFYGNPPTEEQGTMSETHAVRLREGKIIEQFVGDNNFSMPYQELVAWGMEFPRDTPDPNPVIVEASADVPASR
ncbi:MAG: nuclear transport factor 2 family protein [Actinomycetota bacterium]|nr:nuclear transport factor 2 family protein [Actinomycetota bacterium]